MTTEYDFIIVGGRFIFFLFHSTMLTYPQLVPQEAPSLLASHLLQLVLPFSSSRQAAGTTFQRIWFLLTAILCSPPSPL